jgi:hypothetical protein
MGRHREENMIGDIVYAARGGGWRRYARSFDFSKARHNQGRPWAAPILAGLMALLASAPAGLSF